MQNTHQSTSRADLIKWIPPTSSEVALKCDYAVLNYDKDISFLVMLISLDLAQFCKQNCGGFDMVWT